MQVIEDKIFRKKVMLLIEAKNTIEGTEAMRATQSFKQPRP